MDRRSNVVIGCVNFPVNSPQWQNTHEGGMVVKLVVVDDDNNSNQACCGAFIIDFLNESLVGDDSALAEELPERYHYPNVDGDFDPAIKYVSRPYLAAVVLGSTGWSGWNDTEGRYWQCTYQDLTEQGKVLYQQFRDLYPGAKLHLLTFLDT